MTDSRLNLRLLLKSAPTKNTPDSYGYACEYPPVAYTKMKFRIGIKKNASGGYIKQYTITDIPVNGCSPVIEIDLSNYTSNEPYIVEIISASWDYTCIDATNQGHSQAENYCPYANVWDYYCFEVALLLPQTIRRTFTREDQLFLRRDFHHRLLTFHKLDLGKLYLPLRFFPPKRSKATQGTPTELSWSASTLHSFFSVLRSIF